MSSASPAPPSPHCRNMPHTAYPQTSPSGYAERSPYSPTTSPTPPQSQSTSPPAPPPARPPSPLTAPSMPPPKPRPQPWLFGFRVSNFEFRISFLLYLSCYLIHNS